MVMSAHSIFSITICISSLIQHLPGVFFQQAKQPRQGLIFNLATLSVSTFSDCFSSASRYPAKKALVSLSVLLRSTLGLPFMTRIFVHPPAFLSAGYNLLPINLQLHHSLAKIRSHLPKQRVLFIRDHFLICADRSILRCA